GKQERNTFSVFFHLKRTSYRNKNRGLPEIDSNKFAGKTQGEVYKKFSRGSRVSSLRERNPAIKIFP
ncbi:MAG: hypothetical protein LUE95_06140, partial [Oscillospiraceae bacterium]|nr:hypothetical protein [Oscillospiraceae bacterium]